MFDGRASRKEFWMFALLNSIFALIVSIVGPYAVGSLGKINVLYGLYILAIFLPSLALTVRRLHDTNRNGWWIFILLIPLIGGIVLLIFEVLDSTPGDNKYGPNPKGVPAVASV